jgi:HK97 family phage major capsid protein
MATFEFKELDTLRSVEDLADYENELRDRLKAIDADKAGLPFDKTEQEEYDKVKADYDEADRRQRELEIRKRDLARMADDPRKVELEPGHLPRESAAKHDESLFDLSQIRMDITRPDVATAAFREKALRVNERQIYPALIEKQRQRIYGMNNEDAQAQVESHIRNDGDQGWFAQRVLLTGNPAYLRAYAKIMSGKAMVGFTTEETKAAQAAIAFEERAPFALNTTGLPVPYQLDPTVIKVSNGTLNPWRSLASVEQVTQNEWRGVTAAAVTAQYRAEATEATDNTPTLAQPTIVAARADVFIPFSYEVGADWAGLQASMASLIADAKDTLESTKFFSGGGTNEPTGLNAATTGIDVATAGAAAFVIGDLYALDSALPPRFQANASLVGHQGMFNRIRQFDTAGGAGLWVRIGDGIGPGVSNTGHEIMGYPAWKSTAMLNVLTTGSRILLLGDFKYYKIIDRVGMSIELIPNLFGGTANYPTGQRGLYGFWRNGGKLIDQNAFRFLKTA